METDVSLERPGSSSPQNQHLNGIARSSGSGSEPNESQLAVALLLSPRSQFSTPSPVSDSRPDPLHTVLGTPTPDLLAKFKRNGAAHVNFDFPDQKGIGLSQLIPHAAPEW